MHALFNHLMRWEGSKAYSFALDSSGEKIASAFYALEPGTIDRVVLRVDSVTGTPPTYAVRLESLTTNDEYPSGSLIAAGASGTVTPTAAGWETVSLTTPYTVTVGDRIGAVVEYSTGTVDASNHAQFEHYNLTGSTEMPHAASYNGSSWSMTRALPKIWALYDNDTPAHDIAWRMDSSSTNRALAGDDYYGMKISFHQNVTIYALAIWGVGYSTNDIGVAVFDKNDNRLGYDTHDDGNTTAIYYRVYPLSEPVDIDAGDVCRVVCHEPSGGNVYLTYEDLQYPNETVRSYMTGLASCQATNRNGLTGAWTDSNDTINCVWPIGRIRAETGYTGPQAQQIWVS